MENSSYSLEDIEAICSRMYPSLFKSLRYNEDNIPEPKTQEELDQMELRSFLRRSTTALWKDCVDAKLEPFNQVPTYVSKRIIEDVERSINHLKKAADTLPKDNGISHILHDMNHSEFRTKCDLGKGLGYQDTKLETTLYYCLRHLEYMVEKMADANQNSPPKRMDGTTVGLLRAAYMFHTLAAPTIPFTLLRVRISQFFNSFWTRF